MRPDPKNVQWARTLFDSLRDGGIWGIPRSGVIFRRRGDKLVWQHSTVNLTEGVLATAEYIATKAHFESAGVVVTEEYVAPDTFAELSARLTKASRV